MALVKPNSIFDGISGKVGNVVFRQLNGKTVMCKAPTLPKKRKLTPLQQKREDDFRDAATFASKQMRNPETKAEYALLARKMKLRNAYTAAITIYLRGWRELGMETLTPCMSCKHINTSTH